MSVQFDPTRQRYMVRWREAGRQRSERFATRAEAIAFDAALQAARTETVSPDRKA